MPRESPSQTAGPYVHIGCAPRAAGIETSRPDLGAKIITGPCDGIPITLTGTLFDGAAEPVTDGLIELWQADAAGRFPAGNPDSGFKGFGRTTCGENGEFRFETIKPGAIEAAPHVTLWIVARGINLGLHTRAYFEGDDHSADPVLMAVPDARRPSLIARRIAPDTFHFDIHLQGPHETVFFDV